MFNKIRELNITRRILLFLSLIVIPLFFLALYLSIYFQVETNFWKEWAIIGIPLLTVIATLLMPIVLLKIALESPTGILFLLLTLFVLIYLFKQFFHIKNRP